MRYVVSDAVKGARVDDELDACIHADISEARECFAIKGGRIYELGPEVTEPDPSALIEYIKGYGHGGGCAVKHHGDCSYLRDPEACDCGRTEALRKAGL